LPPAPQAGAETGNESNPAMKAEPRKVSPEIKDTAQ